MKKFGTILADPPWPYHSPKAVVGNAGRGADGGRVKEMTQVDVLSHYKVMTMDKIKSLPVKDLAEEKAHLYLWTTNSFLVEAHEVCRCWGFIPKTLLTWVKTQHTDACKPSMKTGYWYRSATEHILFGVKGQLRLKGNPAPTAYLLPRLPHSVKPDFFYELIEAQSPGPYVELFARRSRLDWDCWGDEIESTIDINSFTV
jgi:N6-adenosine-specific RNA methylase IME4